MPDRLPKPLLAALGVLADVRRLPSRLMGASVSVLAAADSLRREYDGLAERGQEVVASYFGGGETPEETPSFEPPVPVLPEETAIVTDAVAHVEDPLDRPRTMPEPVPGYDELTLGALRGRLRSLSTADLQACLRYERAHLRRPPMISLVEHRLAKLALEQG